MDEERGLLIKKRVFDFLEVHEKYTDIAREIEMLEQEREALDEQCSGLMRFLWCEQPREYVEEVKDAVRELKKEHKQAIDFDYILDQIDAELGI